MKHSLSAMVGPLADHGESEFVIRNRVHQGWWRSFVLGETPGPYPNSRQQGKMICSTIDDDATRSLNFLDSTIAEKVNQTLRSRTPRSKGIMQQQRLFHNLLSSQPLAFNFFAIFDDSDYRAYLVQLLRTLLDDQTIREVTSIRFEYAPEKGLTNDNSAFDVAIEFETDAGMNLFGLECKFVDSLKSGADKQIESYRRLYNETRAFVSPFDALMMPDYNQLFRSQLLAEGLVISGEFQNVITGLLCHHEDTIALRIATEFQNMLSSGESRFRIIPYSKYFAVLQRLSLPWSLRELTMLLWCRYCGLTLSDETFRQVQGNLQSHGS